LTLSIEYVVGFLALTYPPYKQGLMELRIFKKRWIRGFQVVAGL
jgi:hypothetical protein